jgi:hypothetical protein
VAAVAAAQSQEAVRQDAALQEGVELGCDYVLLDGKWEQRVRAMADRAAQQGLRINLAKCFSKRNNGLDRFVTELEAH